MGLSRWAKGAGSAMALSVAACLPLQTGKPTYEALVGPVQRVTVGQVDFAYRRFGRGRPLVLIMGITGTMAQWDPRLLARLARRHEVIIFDNPGIGLSRFPDSATLSIPGMAVSTVGLIRRLNLGKPDILGWSMGGQVALTIVARHGDKVDRVIVAAGHAGGPHVVTPTSDALGQLTGTTRNGLARAKTLARLFFPNDQMPAAIRYGASLLAIPQEHVTAAIIRRQRGAVAAWRAGPGVWADLPRIRNQVLIAQGIEDRVLPIENAGLVAARIPGSWLVRFPDAGHAFLFQEADRFADLVDVFLARR